MFEIFINDNYCNDDKDENQYFDENVFGELNSGKESALQSYNRPLQTQLGILFFLCVLKETHTDT